MTHETLFFRAPWSANVRLVSVLGSALLLAIGLGEAIVLPRGLLGGWLALAASGLPLLIVTLCGLFIVRGYRIDRNTLFVKRLFWETPLSLELLRRAWSAPDAMSGSLRLFGNGGLFSITGIFRNRRLGNYRAFAMDPKRAVVLQFPRRRIVVTPDSPAQFLVQLQVATPWVEVGPSPTCRLTPRCSGQHRRIRA